MKAVLISIQPKYCEKIASGEKTIEVRKTRPKIETPFKCYIYKTMGKRKDLFAREIQKYFNCGKIVGEFVCDRIYTYYADDFVGSEDFDGTIITKPKEGEFAYWIPNQEDTCLRYLDIIAYGKGKTLYGWHISKLKIYDKPKELGEFRKPCHYTDGSYCLGNKCEYYNDWSGICCNWVKKPPQSWCYVEELEVEE